MSPAPSAAQAPVPVLIEVPALIDRIVLAVRQADAPLLGSLMATLGTRAEFDDLFLLRERLASDLDRG